MLETIQHWLAAGAEAFANYPQVSAVAASVLLSWAPGLALELLWLPESMSDALCKRISLGVTTAIAFVLSFIAWHAWAPEDPLALNLAVSAAAAIGAPIWHVFAVRWISAKFPSVKSVFTRDPND